MNANTLFVVDRGRSFALRRSDDWSTVFEVDSREELELKMATMGLEVDWVSKSEYYSIWPVRRIR